MTKRAAIILSGGKSERFQKKQHKWQDKALAGFLRKPLLIHMIEKVQDLVEEIVVIVNDEKRKEQYSRILREYQTTNVRLFIDEQIDNLGGPLVAILTGLKSVDAEYCLTLPCDMPMMKPEVIEYLFDMGKESCVVVPMWPNGRLETLVMVLEREDALKIAKLLCQLKRPRSDDIIRGILNVVFVSTVGELAALDPNLESFVNINSPEDLTLLKPRRGQGSANSNMRLDSSLLSVFELQSLQRGAEELRKGRFSEATKSFASCAGVLEKKGMFFWAAISRESEGKSLLEQIPLKKEYEGSAESSLQARKALQEAIVNYDLEAKMHEKNGYVFLAERAKSDKLWVVAKLSALNG